MKTRNLLMASIATLVVGCGGGGGGGGGGDGGGGTATGDAYTNAVRGLVATAQDDTEPLSVDSFTATLADNNESEAI